MASWDINGYHVSCSCWRCHYHPLPLWMYLAFFVLLILFEYPFGMIHFFLLQFDMSSMSSMSSEHWGLSVVGAGGDFLGAGCGWYRIESLAGFDHHLFVTMQHLWILQHKCTYRSWKLHLPHPHFSHEIPRKSYRTFWRFWGFIWLNRFPLLLDFPFELLNFWFGSWQRNCRPAVLNPLVHHVKTFQDL